MLVSHAVIVWHKKGPVLYLIALLFLQTHYTYTNILPGTVLILLKLQT